MRVIHLCVLVLSLCAGSVQAATIMVNSSLDNETNDAFCTLREAIKAANTNTSYNGCVSGSGTDTIV
nr:CSLREA domain-containing protein [Gammaproteobacteria bacterium]